jgi:hypothetical protein
MVIKWSWLVAAKKLFLEKNRKFFIFPHPQVYLHLTYSAKTSFAWLLSGWATGVFCFAGCLIWYIPRWCFPCLRGWYTETPRKPKFFEGFLTSKLYRRLLETWILNVVKKFKISKAVRYKLFYGGVVSHVSLFSIIFWLPLSRRHPE